MLELLAPAGSGASLKAAVDNGANAVYFGLKKFSARGSAENFSADDLSFYASYAKLFGVKLYAAVNTLVKDCELDDFFDSVELAAVCGADAFIVQDMFLGKRLKKEFPEITLHLSTQAGVCNALGAELAAKYGFSRVILARETNLEDIEKISKIIETEAFVQGALCSSFSGHCYMSSFIGGNSGNRGLCKQPCRKKYTYLVDGKAACGGYELSLSDLSVGKNIEKLISAGVSSFKIEGRMRRPEYVAAATKYYRGLLDGKNPENSELKRTFNRNDYTCGLAFGQDKKLISSEIQGHKGEFVGKIQSVKTEKFSEGDGFKIIREGKEIGSAVFDGSKLKYSCKVQGGDLLYITTDVKLNDKLLAKHKKLNVEIHAVLKENQNARFTVNAGGRTFEYSGDVLAPAVNNPLTEEELKICFSKTGDYPFAVSLTAEIGNVFVNKSSLNAMRRDIFSKLFYAERALVKRVKQISEKPFISDIISIENTCILQKNFDFDGIKIIFPEDYNKVTPDKDAYLFLPAYATGKDLEILSKAVEGFCGVYADGYYGIKFAEKHNKKLILGTGINIFNRLDIELSGIKPEKTALSKELSLSEINKFPEECKTFAMGNIPLMELEYCPFGKNCKNCPANGKITLTDEDGRVFKVRRYKLSGCRFVVYNAFDLIPKNLPSGALLFDFSAGDNAEFYLKNLQNTEILRKNIKYTNGNLPKGIL